MEVEECSKTGAALSLVGVVDEDVPITINQDGPRVQETRENPADPSPAPVSPAIAKKIKIKHSRQSNLSSKIKLPA